MSFLCVSIVERWSQTNRERKKNMMNQEMMNAKVEDIQILLEENGVTLSDEEIEKMLVLADATSDDELSEELLDIVAGGGFFSWLWNKLYEKNCRDLKRLCS